MSDELGVIDGWLYGLLRNDAALMVMLGKHPKTGECVYDTLAIADAGLPYVIFHLQAPILDTIAVGHIRIAANAAYSARAIGLGGFATVRPIAARIDDLLHGARGEGASGVVLSCHRQNPLKLPPETASDGRVYYHQGGIYRVQARVA